MDQKTFTLELPTLQFNKLVEAAPETKISSQKRLTTPLLNEYLSGPIGMIEQIKVKLTHSSSTINMVKLRGDEIFLLL